MITIEDQRNPHYKSGYKSGFAAGYSRGKTDVLKKGIAYWIMTKGGWICSNCCTKHNQAHDDYCCKCGSFMNPNEADV